MKKKALALVGTLSLLLGLEARAQSSHRKFELGGHFVVFGAHSTRFPDNIATGPTNHIDDLVLGGGLRGGYRFAKKFAVDAEVSVFQRPPTDDPATLGRWSQGFFGLKATKRLGELGVFWKVRPGFARFDGITSGELLPDGSVGVRLIRDNTFFAVDIGGGIELYTSQRTIIRFDVGDAIIRYTDRPASDFHPVSNPALRTYYGHNVQISVCFAIRF